MNPRNDIVIVEPVQEPDEAKSILEVVDGKRSTAYRRADTTRRWGKVIAVGPGRKKKNGERAPMSVKPGDTVFFGYSVGMGLHLPNKPEYLVMREADILMVVEDAGWAA